jgi:hypothetical protein
VSIPTTDVFSFPVEVSIESWVSFHISNKKTDTVKRFSLSFEW